MTKKLMHISLLKTTNFRQELHSLCSIFAVQAYFIMYELAFSNMICQYTTKKLPYQPYSLGPN